MSEEVCVSLTGNTYSVPITALKFLNNILLAGMCLLLNIIELLQLLTSNIPKKSSMYCQVFYHTSLEQCLLSTSYCPVVI